MEPAPGLDIQTFHTSNFPNILSHFGISLAVSTYQAGRVILLRADGGLINSHFRSFDKPMGLAADREKLAIGTTRQIWELRNLPAAAAQIEPVGKHDACYLPRRSHVTGDIDIHEMAYVQNELWFVNTRWSCLCALDTVHSFVPRWRPPFVTAYDVTDRCHLNGMGLRDGQVRYITALGESDRREDWRENKASGGILMDIQTNTIICRGLSMPHSPRWYSGQLWVLESGQGRLARVDPLQGRWESIVEVPGFTRGLDFWGPLAFIGLSQVRETAMFSGLPLTERLAEAERTCGIWVVNIHSGEVVAFLRFEGAVQEIFAVTVLPGTRFPEVIDWDEKILDTSFALPDEALRELALPEVNSVDATDPTESLPTASSPEVQRLFEVGLQAMQQRNLTQAVEHFQQCLAVEPDFLLARFNLGSAYIGQDRWSEALAELQQVVMAKPDFARAQNNLGWAYHNLNQIKAAIDHYRQAIDLRHQLPDAHLNLGMALLQVGEWEEGWAEYEWRQQTDQVTPFVCPHPVWDGNLALDKTILLHTEQGAGDAMQFIRYLPLVRVRCKRVLLVCMPELASLFATVVGLDQVFTPGEIPLSEFQLYASLMSLPHLLGTTLKTIPTQVPYLRVPPQAQLQLPAPLLPSPLSPCLKVGIAWAGSSGHRNNHNRSCKLSDFLPVLQIPGVAFYSLQKPVPPLEQLQLKEYGVQDLSPMLTTFAETAAAISHLDLVISVDTSVVHLSGAIAKPVWTLLCYSPDWRWMLQRSDSPWYPSMRLFRQNQPQNWAEVFLEVATALKTLVASTKVQG